MLTCQISLDVLPMVEAWAAHASLRGKDMQAVFRKVMRFAVDFLIAKTPKGDRVKLKNNLHALTETYLQESAKSGRRRLKSAGANKWRGTVAASIVFRLNYNGARTAAMERSPKFYAEVGRFVAGRNYALNLHAAGFRPAQRELHGAFAGVRLPGFKREPTGGPGRITSSFNSDTVAGILVENWAQAADVPGRPSPIGAQGVLGDKIKELMPDLDRLFAKFLQEDIIRAAKVAGFKAAA